MPSHLLSPLSASLLQAHDDTSVSRTSKVLRSELRQNQIKGGVHAMGGDGGDLTKRRRSSLEDLKVSKYSLFVSPCRQRPFSSNATPTIDPAKKGVNCNSFSKSCRRWGRPMVLDGSVSVFLQEEVSVLACRCFLLSLLYPIKHPHQYSSCERARLCGFSSLDCDLGRCDAMGCDGHMMLSGLGKGSYGQGAPRDSAECVDRGLFAASLREHDRGIG